MGRGGGGVAAATTTTKQNKNDPLPFLSPPQAANRAPARYVELDLPDVVSRKAATVRGDARLAAAVGGALPPRAASISTSAYSVLPIDLRSSAAVLAALDGAGIDRAAPTLILAECVLVYLPPTASAALAFALATHLADAVVLVFEPVRPDDPFGRQMVSNVAARGSPLLGLAATRTLADHEARWKEAGWDRAAAISMAAAWAGCVEPGGRRRAEAAARLDEVEEWRLLLDHYAFVLAVRGAGGVCAGLGWRSYGGG